MNDRFTDEWHPSITEINCNDKYFGLDKHLTKPRLQYAIRYIYKPNYKCSDTRHENVGH